MKLILASQSRRRKILLENLGLDFEVIPAYADEESINGEKHSEHVQDVAKLKVDIIAKDHPDAIIIGADGMVEFESKRIGKPKDIQDAIRILSMLSGKEHEVYSGFVIRNTKTGEEIIDSQVTAVKFRKLTEAEIIKWANHPDTLTGAGAYTEKTNPFLIEKIEGSQTNIWGLPMEKVIPALRKMGVDI